MVAVAISAIDPLFPILDEDWTRLDTGPPIVEVESYAVVGNFVLLSIVRDPFTEQTNSSSLVLSIMEVPVRTDANAMAAVTTNFPVISGAQFFSQMGNGVICSVGCCIHSWSYDEEHERDNICIHFYGHVNAGEGDAELQRDGNVLPSSNPSKYLFRLNEPLYKLIAPTLVSAMWMDVI